MRACGRSCMSFYTRQTKIRCVRCVRCGLVDAVVSVSIQDKLKSIACDAYDAGLWTQYKQCLFNNFLHFLNKTLPDIRIFCGYKHKSSHTHHTQTQNNNLWIIQRVTPCGNPTRCTLRGSRLPNHRANRAVLDINKKIDVIQIFVLQLYR
ncbi:hypothetical protein SFRURICE_004834 [Spodoptera frugiperda]|nr:hypothetical protein SFRURICE_004834 [Spodoptera frugiperda]